MDSAVSVNEESSDAARLPGRAALASTVLLVTLYVTVAVAAQAWRGPGFLAENRGDVLRALGTEVLGHPLDKLLGIAVLLLGAALMLLQWHREPGFFRAGLRRTSPPAVAD